MKKKRYKYIHKVKNEIKDNIKIVIGVIIGIIWTSGVAYAATIYYASANVSYDNGTSGLSATTVQDALDELYVESNSYQEFESRVSTLESKVYPVGSIYISTTKSTTAQVASLFGGTWCAISQGRVLIGAGTNGTYTFSAGSTGGSTDAGNRSSATPTVTNPKGEYTHKLVTAEMPSHAHTTYSASVVTGGSSASYKTKSGTSYNFTSSSSIGNPVGGSAGSDYYHNNIQPYLVVYMYKRVADNASC